MTGIYMIKSKKKPDRVYIGSSVHIKKRWNYHKEDLRKNSHHSSKLQNHYNKYGENDLVFEVFNLRNKAVSYTVTACGVPEQSSSSELDGAVNQEINSNVQHCVSFV